MTKAELNAYIRVLVDDVEADYLCADTSLNRFIDEAEREVAERTLYFKLGDSHDFSTVASTAEYAIHTDIIFIDRIKISGEKLPLLKTTKKELDCQIQDWETIEEKPLYYYIYDNKIRLYPVPDDVYSIVLDGSRRPVSEMETPVHLHEDLAYWVMYRYYSIQDADVQNRQKAEENRAKFRAIFGNKRNIEFEQSWRNDAGYASMRAHPFN
ncbi:MAG: hypothetical protein GQ569_09250 [Methylococcaceae bacterium]|nr:hypothetical protein [Methylococcaceae bacterium]